jgi:hypothetical protein
MNKWTKVALDRVGLLDEFLKDNPNPTGKQVKNLKIQIVVADRGWQELRGSFVGTWKHTPEENVKRLSDYVGDMNDPLKVRRVLNYLTGSAFRIGIVEGSGVEELRKKIRNSWKKLQ